MTLALLLLWTFFFSPQNATASRDEVHFLRTTAHRETVLGVRFNHYNGRGDVVSQTDGAGATQWEAAYEAYGKRVREVGTTKDRQKANTKDEDPTGLLNEGMRYRDLETGVWLSRDPAGFVDGPNLYAYVTQNPWSKFDPDGLAAVMIIRGEEDYNRVSELQKKGLPLYEGVKLVKGFRDDGSASQAWEFSQHKNGSRFSLNGHAYDEGKLAYDRAVYYFDNKEHLGGVKKNFDEASWIAIGGQVAATALSAPAAAAGGPAGMVPNPRIGKPTGDAVGPLENAAFAQKTFSKKFSSEGAFAGKTVDEVAGALKSQKLNVGDVPVEYIVRDGKTLILNTRSAQALQQAGVPRSQWNAVNMTGNAAAEARLTGQLERNGLDSQGIQNPRPTGR